MRTRLLLSAALLSAPLAGCACFTASGSTPVRFEGSGACGSAGNSAFLFDGEVELDATGCEGSQFSFAVDDRGNTQGLECDDVLATFDADGEIEVLSYDCTWANLNGVCEAARDTADGTDGLAIIDEVEAIWSDNPGLPGDQPQLSLSIRFHTNGGSLEGGRLRMDAGAYQFNDRVTNQMLGSGDWETGEIELNLTFGEDPPDPTGSFPTTIYLIDESDDVGAVWIGEIGDPNYQPG